MWRSTSPPFFFKIYSISLKSELTWFVFFFLLPFQSGTKEIHLKHGKLHPHHDNKQYQDDDHIVYRYRWLEDDIVKSDDELEGVEDDEYTDKEKKVKLPGGCELTENQYLELESFKKETQYVKKW